MNVDTVIKKRHSVRKFKTKKPNYVDIFRAIEAATKAPFAGNLQTLKFILVDEKKKIQELAEAAVQDFVATAHYVLIVCSDTKQCTRCYDERGLRYSRQQAGAAIENFLLRLTSLGLSTCWVGAFSDKTVKRILQLPEEIEVEAMFPIGYEMEKGKQRKKTDLASCIYFNVWKNKYMRKIRRPEAR